MKSDSYFHCFSVSHAVSPRTIESNGNSTRSSWTFLRRANSKIKSSKSSSALLGNSSSDDPDEKISESGESNNESITESSA